MKQGFWAGIYEFLASMDQAGNWMLYIVMGLIVAGLFAWAVWAWNILRREAGI